jgi:copper(I)-binding protein
MKTFWWVIGIVWLLPGFAGAAGPDVVISHGWMRYLLPSLPAAGYMTVENNGDADVVIAGAASPACGMLMLHKSQDDSGMAMMMDVPSVTVPAHGSVNFAPGGYHLMCMSPVMKVGDKVAVTLTLQGGGSIATTVPVYGAQDGP